MISLSRLDLNRKALRDFGFRQLGLYTWYRLALRSGAVRRAEARQMELLRSAKPAPIASPLVLPDRREIAALSPDPTVDAIAEAEEILSDQVRLFGGPPVPLQLGSPGPLAHWTVYEGKSISSDGKDIKWTWEPGRFGWAFTLGRAFHLTGDDRFAGFFWQRLEAFNRDNPPFLGPQWVSAQEVALRLIALAFAAQVFAPSSQSTSQRLEHLSAAMAVHAVRIPFTLSYARAQNNNHLLSEAAGLITGSAFLPEHPMAGEWQRLGWHWFNYGLQSQITADGAYVQHSANYHRLALQIALWVRTLGRPFPEQSLERLATATRWLLTLLDPQSGHVPNLGPNDGASILPLSSCPLGDYRPTLQAACLAFLGQRAFEAGPWDETVLWLVDREARGKAEVLLPNWKGASLQLQDGPHILRRGGQRSWAYLRAARFTSRPGHADQLHLDLWWQGLNLALDAGTYLYNAPPPWDNALACTDVHNTLTVDDWDQMTRAGRFLWLDWAQARVVAEERTPDGPFKHLEAEHDGYRKFGLTHRRAVTAQAGERWIVKDEVFPVKRSSRGKAQPQPMFMRLHWLLPDWPWEIEIPAGNGGAGIRLGSPFGRILLRIRPDHAGPLDGNHTLASAGELLSGKGPVLPTWGWYSPTYSVKEPALSFALQVVARPPVVLVSEWVLP